MKNFKFLLGVTLCATMLMHFDNVLAINYLPQLSHQSMVILDRGIIVTDVISVHESQTKTDGGIVMTDVIMAVTVNDEEDIIQNVVVLSLNGEPVYQKDGCGTNHCTFNLSGVAPGTYLAIAYTEQGSSISATIQL